MSFDVREAVDSDLESLIALGLLSYGMYAELLGPEPWSVMREKLSRRETYEELLKMSTGFVCESEGRLLGMVFLIPSGNPTPVFDASWSYVRMLGVDPEAQGNGIARRLMQLCIDRARSTGEQFLALHTSEFMDAARHIYGRLGFDQIREVGPFFNRKYWLYLLKL
jgi:GNAT superfamily N-acetyltransferase